MLQRSSLFALAIALTLPLGLGRARGAESAGESAGSCTHSVAAESAPGTSAVDLPDYASDEDATPDPRAQAAEAAWKDYQRSVFDALNRSSDPRDMALATITDVLRFEPSTQRDEESRRLLARAVSAAPNDALVQLIALRGAKNLKDEVTARATARRLQQLEPDNAAVFLDDLSAAAARKDEAAVEKYLAAMSAGSRFDLHFAELIQGTVTAYARFPVTPADFGAATDRVSADAMPYVQAMAVVAAIALPAFQDLVNTCRAHPGRVAAHEADCAAIGRLMAANSDTLIANRIGYAVLRVSRTYTESDEQRARLDDWVYDNYSQAVSAAGDEQATQHIVSFQRDWIESGSELEAMRRSLAALAVAPVPSDEWNDPQSPFSAERLARDAEWQTKNAAVK